MRVEMLIHITGTRNGEDWPPVGGVIDLPDHEARRMIDVGYAKEATSATKTADSDETTPSDLSPASSPEDSGTAPTPRKTKKKTPTRG